MDLSSGKTYICRHVRFDECVFPFNTGTMQQVPSPTPLPWASGPIVPLLQAPVCEPGPSPVTEAVPIAQEPPCLAITHTAPPRARKRTRVHPPDQGHVMRLRHMTRVAPEVFQALTASVDPTCYSQAVGHPQWRDAMDQEFNALLHNNTWKLVPPEPNMNIIGCKWVFRTKRTADGSIERYKARLVAKGFNQVAGEDFFDTFSPVVKPTTPF
ncbi:PREDICTED: uncharacterized protein LOC109190958 [Ipomoea nil]|uniref:uncharacterized protein LOC109190958 n=1 Tax=Ipomoea nil TaxID=35883 RepID=UPI000901B1A9|nr:PREDICTED: uncharacterized protein LOC109190958 [Ipomoea nil]